MAAGLANEGTNAIKPRAGDLARKDTPTCHLTEHLAEVRDRVRGLGWDAVAVWRQAIVVLACIAVGAGLGLVPALVTKGPIDYLARGGQNSIRHDRRSSVNA